MTVDTRLMTADELLRMKDQDARYELVKGELRKMSPSSHEHGDVALEIGARLRTYVREHRLGKAYAAETGFLISRNPDTVRAPDVAFVRTDRLVHTPGFFPGPPDLAIEVISPNDSYSDVEEKTLQWLRAGVRAVVTVDPRLKSVRIHRSNGSTTATDLLEVPEVVPGWSVPVAEIFE